MHPGWQVFFQGFASGIFTVGVAAWASKGGDIIGVAVWGALALICFYCGGSNAENLMRRKP